MKASMRNKNNNKTSESGRRPDDERIVEMFLSRSEDAIRALDDKYGALCRSVAYNVTHSREDAEECVNDAYLAVWNTVPPERPDPLRAYVCRITRNLALKRYEKNTAGKRICEYADAMDEIEPFLPSAENVEDEVETRELARLIEEFLDSLDRKNRTVFMRRYWFSDSYRDIAKRTGLTVKNVSVRLVRLRERMREFLTEKGVNI